MTCLTNRAGTVIIREAEAHVPPASHPFRRQACNALMAIARLPRRRNLSAPMAISTTTVSLTAPSCPMCGDSTSTEILLEGVGVSNQPTSTTSDAPACAVRRDTTCRLCNSHRHDPQTLFRNASIVVTGKLEDFSIIDHFQLQFENFEVSITR